MKLFKADELTHLNERLIKRYGGLFAPASNECLERVDALCQRVLMIVQYEQLDDLVEIAAAYTEAIARGHVFADANKRTAVNALYLFLHRNGIKTKVPDDLADIIVNLASGALTRDAFASYIKNEIAAKNE